MRTVPALTSTESDYQRGLQDGWTDALAEVLATLDRHGPDRYADARQTIRQLHATNARRSER